MKHTFVALGSNVTSDSSSSPEILEACVDILTRQGLRPLAASRIYATPAFPAGSGPDYANAVISLDVGGVSPHAVLERLHSVESLMGRKREKRWGPRTLDLDLLDMDGRILPDRAVWEMWRDLPPDRQAQEAPDRLILPHPRLQDRAFVLVPLRDVAPGWRHPVTGQSIDALIAALPEEDMRSVVPLEDGPAGWPRGH